MARKETESVERENVTAEVSRPIQSLLTDSLLLGSHWLSSKLQGHLCPSIRSVALLHSRQTTRPSRTCPPEQIFQPYSCSQPQWGTHFSVALPPSAHHPQSLGLVKNISHKHTPERKVLDRPLLKRPSRWMSWSLGASSRDPGTQERGSNCPMPQASLPAPLPRPPKTKASFSLLLGVTTFSSDLCLFSFCLGPSWLASPSTTIPWRQTLYCFHRPNK